MKYSPSRLGHPGQSRSLNRLHLPRLRMRCMGVVTGSSSSRRSLVRPFLGPGHRRLSRAAPISNSACDVGAHCELAPRRRRTRLHRANHAREPIANPGAISRGTDQRARPCAIGVLYTHAVEAPHDATTARWARSASSRIAYSQTESKVGRVKSAADISATIAAANMALVNRPSAAGPIPFPRSREAVPHAVFPSPPLPAASGRSLL
jgi:hypothetical protein